jgi:hypothetical protein
MARNVSDIIAGSKVAVIVSFPFYDHDTTLKKINLVANNQLPFINHDGAPTNIYLTQGN